MLSIKIYVADYLMIGLFGESLKAREIVFLIFFDYSEKPFCYYDN